MFVVDIGGADTPGRRRPFPKTQLQILDGLFVDLELFQEVEENMMINRVVEGRQIKIGNMIEAS